jgi:hypothetical protein
VAQIIPKLVRNQLLFREVNERLRETIGAFEGPLEFLCECSQEDCIETVGLALEEYERIRSHSNLFVVVTGHERIELERVIDQGQGYLLVEKTVGADAVVKADPRSQES